MRWCLARGWGPSWFMGAWKECLVCVVCRYVFDGLSEDQAMELLVEHGQDGTYLVINNSSNNTWSFIVRQR